MSDENELNESEMDQLLRELEQKASSKPKEAEPKKVETPTKEKKTTQKLPKDKPKSSEVSNPQKKESESKVDKAKGVSVVQRGSSESLNKKVTIFLLVFTTPIVLTAIWMLGNYLASFVSVGWLIALVAFFAVFALSYFFKRIVGKGRFMIWSGLTSLILSVLMLLPGSFAATKILEYGHWPVSSITQASGLENDNTFVDFSSAIAKSIADFRSSFDGAEPLVVSPKVLGTQLPLVAPPEVEKAESENEGDEKENDESEKSADKKEGEE